MSTNQLEAIDTLTYIRKYYPYICPMLDVLADSENLTKNGRINVSKIMKLCGLTQLQVKTYLDELKVIKNLLEDGNIKALRFHRQTLCNVHGKAPSGLFPASEEPSGPSMP